MSEVGETGTAERDPLPMVSVGESGEGIMAGLLLFGVEGSSEERNELKERRDGMRWDDKKEEGKKKR